MIDWSLVAVTVSVSPRSIFHTSSGVPFLFIFFWRVVSLDKSMLLRFYAMSQVTRHVLSTPNGNQHKFNATQNYRATAVSMSNPLYQYPYLHCL